jgi:hypothetical protein
MKEDLTLENCSEVRREEVDMCPLTACNVIYRGTSRRSDCQNV